MVSCLHQKENKMKEVLENYIGKNINVIMTGGSGATFGKLTKVNNHNFVMETRWATKHYFDISKVESVWAEEDKND